MSTYDDIADECARQLQLWGDQDHLDVDQDLLGRPQRMCERYEIPSEDRAKQLIRFARERGDLTWAHIAVEELSEAVEAFAREDRAQGRTELVQLAAVIVSWIESIDRRPR